ncbi:MAG: DUF4347 domain-containing protein [Mesorhizobium sp.]
MLRAKEILFIDSAVSDVSVLIAGMRSDVEPVLLSGNEPALAEIARLLEGRQDLDAIHIISHGRPGALYFGTGAVSQTNLSDHQDSVSQLGRALNADGKIVLWSCETGAGSQGRDFISALSSAIGVSVAASEQLVGASAKGGSWNIAAAKAPLTAEGIANYAGVLAPNYVTVTVPANNNNDWDGFYYIVTQINGQRTIIGEFTVSQNSGTNFAHQLYVPINYTDTETLIIETGFFNTDGEVQVWSTNDIDSNIKYELDCNLMGCDHKSRWEWHQSRRRTSSSDEWRRRNGCYRRCGCHWCNRCCGGYRCDRRCGRNGCHGC